MSATSLKKLTIEHLRGSVVPFSLPFEPDKKLAVVYGENGTGKSCICDAFEFIGKGRVGSLENRGLGKTTRYWPSVGKQPADVSVTLEAVNATCRATIVKSDVVVNPSAARPKVEVLRRSQILTLIEAKPGDRYAAISRFIDVSGIETSEGTLRELIRELTDSRQVAIARVQENLDAIIQFWETAGKQGKDHLIWAEAESKRDPGSSAAELAALAALQTAFTRLTDYPSQLKIAEQAVRTAQEAAVIAKNEADKCAKTIAADASETMGILEAASGYFHKHPTPADMPIVREQRED